MRSQAATVQVQHGLLDLEACRLQAPEGAGCQHLPRAASLTGPHSNLFRRDLVLLDRSIHRELSQSIRELNLLPRVQLLMSFRVSGLSLAHIPGNRRDRISQISFSMERLFLR